MRKASVVSMNSIFNHVGGVGSNAKLEAQPWLSTDCEKQSQKAYYNYYGSWKNKNLAMPWAMIVISFVQFGLHFVQVKYELHDDLAFIPSERHQVWRYITYMFVHVDALHLFSNILLQIISGSIVEGDQGHLRVALVYLGGIIAGGLGWTNPDLSIIGCSSGSYALFFSQIPQTLLNHDSIKYFRARIICLVVSIISASIYEGYMILYATNFLHEIAISSHFFGCLAGIVIGFVIYEKTHRVVKFTFAFILFYLLGLAVIYNIYALP